MDNRSDFLQKMVHSEPQMWRKSTNFWKVFGIRFLIFLRIWYSRRFILHENVNWKNSGDLYHHWATITFDSILSGFKSLSRTFCFLSDLYNVFKKLVNPGLFLLYFRPLLIGIVEMHLKSFYCCQNIIFGNVGGSYFSQ